MGWGFCATIAIGVLAILIGLLVVKATPPD